jgi:hypothetical protein
LMYSLLRWSPYTTSTAARAILFKSFEGWDLSPLA